MLGLGGRTFRHGVHPSDSKHLTAALPIERMPWVDEYVMPLSQHIGAPSKAIVEPGEEVVRGQTIAVAGGFVSVAQHAPVTGRVVAIEPRPHPSGGVLPAIVIRTDPYASQRFASSPEAGEPIPSDQLVERVQAAGIVGLGGAAFPSHVKLQVPPDRRARFAVLNGCECEPFLTCDHRVMVERADAVLRGLVIIMGHVGAERGYVGVEDNKPDAIAALRKAAEGIDASIEIVPLRVKYPQGAEKLLVDAIFRREIPTGKLPLDLEMVIHNVGTAAALADLVDTRSPLVERVVTVTGPGIRRPSNLLVPLGTPLRAIIDHCGGLLPEAREVVLGGPMMGQAQKDLEAPITKGISGVLVLTGGQVAYTEEEACIRCGRCLEACPMFLNPTRLGMLSRAEQFDELESHHALNCFECGSCAYVCPSHIPLVQLIRLGKAEIRNRKARK